MDNEKNHENPTPAEFARTVLRNMGWCVLLLAVAAAALQYILAIWAGRDLTVSAGFAVTAVLYLAFIFAWALAYAKYFQFPERQGLLLAGAGIAAAIASLLSGAMRLAYGLASPIEWLADLPGHILGSFLGALLQIYILAVVLRYVKRSRLPF